jgi:hypothetical protein
MVYIEDLKSSDFGHAGSSPAPGTILFRDWGFKSLQSHHPSVAQWIEQQPSKLWVVGSIPTGRAT